MLFLAVAVISCAPQPVNIVEAEVQGVVEGFFEALDVDNEDPNLLDLYVTEDFIIYEMGKKMTRQEFKELISEDSPATSSEWQLSDYRISTDLNSAHASFKNNGTFEVNMDSFKVRYNYEWLESAYLVKANDRLKIKFYFSDNLHISADTIQ
jgi:hypothetical protein